MSPRRPPVSVAALEHRALVEVPDWRRIPAFADASDEDFLDPRWQAKRSVTRPEKLAEVLRGLVDDAFLADAAAGFDRAPMAMRISPYLLALVDWERPYDDPIRIQFLPLGSRLLPDHPKLGLDPLHERADAAVPGLTHRYTDRALFLPLDTCPVYCRFCTRSYAVGTDTANVEKVSLGVDEARWRRAFEYIASRPEIEDVVVSGGDAYNLRPEQIRTIGDALLGIPHVRRLRVATKGPAVMPQKVLRDPAWTDAVTRLAERGRTLHKDVVLHTHFNSPNEITGLTRDAMMLFFERGITVRNQSVLVRGVNDDPETMKLLVRRLAYLHVQPYYVYVHDIVKGVEDLRTTVATGERVESEVRGATAGFNTPTVVVDAPGGGGKREVHSWERYDRVTGISVWTAPAVRPGQRYVYFDPIDQLPAEGQRRWSDPREHARMIEEALA